MGWATAKHSRESVCSIQVEDSSLGTYSNLTHSFILLEKSLLSQKVMWELDSLGHQHCFLPV